ncbi:MAG: alpha-glucosidase [Gaiellaceae bacterium]|nr:alpha-glucosidase [Gaiellaceae bacterium]
MSAVETDRATLLGEPHHDGSELYVERAADAATVRLRASGIEPAGVRYVVDGEPRVADAVSEGAGWWRATIPTEGPRTSYRWLLTGGELGYGWLNGTGVVDHDIPDDDDFVLTRDPGGPDWHLDSVVYQIFPDRFASSGPDVAPPEWAIPRAWDDPPTGRGPETPFEWFGGDLRGIEQRLDYIESLGANVVYLTPIFPAGSTHRYDSTTFDSVDPLLGGDEAFESLARAAHARGMRVVGDLTLNHTGDGHEWFAAARKGGEERGFYLFGDDGDYVSWLGVSSLPKLDWRSAELRERMDGVIRQWLDAGLDGWRIDVANMTGRYRETDVNHEVAQAARAAVGDALLLAEHNHDSRADLQGGGWHGTMNYPGFTLPVWCWLRADGVEHPFLGLPVPIPRFAGRQAIATMRAFRAGLPWPQILHSWLLLDSHDTARFRTVAGSRDRQLVGVGLQMTMPGVPMIFAGDELGLEGDWGEDARRTMPWDRPDSWDKELLEEYRRLISLRRSHGALARGGIRYAYVGEDAIAYLRETRDERLLCLAARADHAPIRLSLDSLEADELETLYGVDATVLDGDVILPADGPAFSVWKLERSPRG